MYSGQLMVDLKIFIYDHYKNRAKRKLWVSSHVGSRVWGFIDFGESQSQLSSCKDHIPGSLINYLNTK